MKRGRGAHNCTTACLGVASPVGTDGRPPFLYGLVQVYTEQRERVMAQSLSKRMTQHDIHYEIK